MLLFLQDNNSTIVFHFPQLAVKSFPRKRDGNKGSAELCGRIEKGDFLVAVNSIRLEGFAFQDAIRVLTSQVLFFALLLLCRPLSSFDLRSVGGHPGAIPGFPLCWHML